MPLLRALIVCCAAWLALPPTVAVAAGGRVALVIGNDNYADASARLNNSVNDARDIGETLTALGFKVVVKHNATGTVLKEAIRDFARRVEGAEVALFFYAGHALQARGTNYLIPIDAALKTEGDVLLDGIDATNVLSVMNDGAARKILIFDSCRDNPFKGVKTSTGLAQMDAQGDTLIAYSTAPGKVAYDGADRNSVYTRSLVKNLPNQGEEIRRTFAKVSEAVRAETKSARVPQTPVVLDSFRPAELYLAGAPGASPPPPTSPKTTATASPGPSADGMLAAEREFWVAINKSSRSELELFLGRFPKGFYADLANAKLLELNNAAQASTTGQGGAGGVATTTPPVTPPAVQQAAAPSPAAQQAPSPAAPSPAAQQAALPAAPSPSVKQAPPQQTAAPPPAKPDAEPLVVVAKVDMARDVPKQPPRLSQSDLPVMLAPLIRDKNDLVFSDGSFYRGPSRNNIPNGIGDYQGINGLRYSGDYRDGRWEGKGAWSMTNGTRYEGDLRAGQPDGVGTMVFESGDVYRGNFVAGARTGKGRYTFAKSNDVYEGDLVDGEFTGKGVLKTGKGEVFEGEFAKGKLNGIGSHREAELFYQGQFRDAIFEGQGTLQLSNGLVYVGQFVAGVAKGKGSLSFGDGRRFDGNFQDGLRNAKGTLLISNGERRPAEIIDGRLEAQ